MGFVTHAIKSVAFNSMLFMQINNTFESEIKRGWVKIDKVKTEVGK